MSDRRLADCTPAELLEAALLAEGSFVNGKWDLELRVEDAKVRRLRGRRWDSAPAVTVGRDQLGSGGRAA